MFIYFALAVSLLQILYFVIFFPYTKVEESFNVQAVHDHLLYYFGMFSDYNIFTTTSTNLLNYDHLVFPGVVPRSFIGSLVLAFFTYPFHILSSWILQLPKIYMLFCFRIILGLITWISFYNFLQSILLRFGNRVRGITLILTVLQFHINFYASRTLPNTFGLIFSYWALSFWFINDGFQCLCILGSAIILFRCDLILLFLPMFACMLFSNEIQLVDVLLPGIIVAIFVLGTSVLTDSYYWQYWVWPEGVVLFFNTVQNKSSEWGVQSWHWYLTSALPRTLNFQLLLSVMGYFGILRYPHRTRLIQLFKNLNNENDQQQQQHLQSDSELLIDPNDININNKNQAHSKTKVSNKGYQDVPFITLFREFFHFYQMYRFLIEMNHIFIDFLLTQLYLRQVINDQQNINADDDNSNNQNRLTIHSIVTKSSIKKSYAKIFKNKLPSLLNKTLQLSDHSDNSSFDYLTKTRQLRVAYYGFPAFMFILLYSFLPHKELRFLLPVLPLLTWLAAIAIDDIIMPSVFTTQIIDGSSSSSSSSSTDVLTSWLASLRQNLMNYLSFGSTQSNNNDNNGNNDNNSNNTTSPLNSPKIKNINKPSPQRNVITFVKMRSSLWPFTYLAMGNTFDIVESELYGFYDSEIYVLLRQSSQLEAIKKKSFNLKLINVIISSSLFIVFLASILTSILLSSASYTNYPGGIALNRLLYTHLSPSGLYSHHSLTLGSSSSVVDMSTSGTDSLPSIASSPIFLHDLLDHYHHSMNCVNVNTDKTVQLQSTATYQWEKTVYVHISPTAAMTGISRFCQENAVSFTLTHISPRNFLNYSSINRVAAKRESSMTCPTNSNKKTKLVYDKEKNNDIFMTIKANINIIYSKNETLTQYDDFDYLITDDLMTHNIPEKFHILEVIKGFSRLKFDRKELFSFFKIQKEDLRVVSGKHTADLNKMSMATTTCPINSITTKDCIEKINKQAFSQIPLPLSLNLHNLPLLSAISMIQEPKLYILCQINKSCPLYE